MKTIQFMSPSNVGVYQSSKAEALGQPGSLLSKPKDKASYSVPQAEAGESQEADVTAKRQAANRVPVHSRNTGCQSSVWL